MNKKILIGLGVLAVVGIAVYMKKKYKDSLPAPSPEETGNSGGRPAETKANAVGKKLQMGKVADQFATSMVTPNRAINRSNVKIKGVIPPCGNPKVAVCEYTDANGNVIAFV